MEKFSVNFGVVESELKPKAPIFKYEDVKHRLEKVAFDIVRFIDADNIDGLWQIQNTDDGDIIVAMYSDEDDMWKDTEKTASTSTWEAVTDSSGGINIFYKNSPVTKISLAKLGMDHESPENVCYVLSEKLSSNTDLLGGLLATLSSDERKNLLNAHPELAEMVNGS